MAQPQTVIQPEAQHDDHATRVWVALQAFVRAQDRREELRETLCLGRGTGRVTALMKLTAFNNTIALYGRTVKFVLKHQTVTLLVTIGTLVATIWMYIAVPKGFFPVQDTGVIMGITDAPESKIGRAHV